MIKAVFTDPQGESFENPDLNWLKGLVFNEGDDFWDVDSGQAAVRFYENDSQKSFMYLKGLEAYGFMIDYSIKDPSYNSPIYTLKHGEHTGETVEAYIGGDPELHYREFFVPREVAWEVIEHFLKTGERKPTLVWEIEPTLEVA